MKEFGSEYHLSYMKDDYFENISKRYRYSIYLQTGREALLLAAKTIRGKKVLLMPAYCCWSMEAPFIQEGFEIIYYKLNEDLTVNIKYITQLLKKYHPTIVLTMNYFGFTSTADVIMHIKQYDANISIIEDFSHCLFDFDSIYNPQVDYYIASIRKSIGVPDGALYLSNKYADNIEIKSSNDEYTSIRISGGQLKTLYRYKISEKEQFYSCFSKAATMLKNETHINIHRMSDDSLHIINHTYVDACRFARNYNYKHLYEKLSKNKALMLPFSPHNQHTSPFTLPIIVENRDVVQAILAQYSVYAPVLWPINSVASKVCNISSYFAEKMLAIPIDQRYDYYDIEEIGDRINNYIR